MKQVSIILILLILAAVSLACEDNAMRRRWVSRPDIPDNPQGLVELITGTPNSRHLESWGSRGKEVVTRLVDKGVQAVPPIISALEDDEGHNFYVLAFVLGEIGPPSADAVPFLIEALEGEGGIEFRMEATTALGKIAPVDREVIYALIRSFMIQEYYSGWYSQEKVRYTIANALKMGSPVTLPFLINALDSENTAIRESSAYTLGIIGPGASIATTFLIEILSEGRDMFSYQAAAALARIGGGPEVMSALSEALHDDRFRVRVVAAWALCELGPDGISELVSSMDNPDEDARVQVINALKSIIRPGSWEGLDNIRLPAIGMEPTYRREMIPILYLALEDERELESLP